MIRQIECAPAPRAQVRRAAWVMSEPDLLSESEHGRGDAEWILDSTSSSRRRGASSAKAARGRRESGRARSRDERTRRHRQGAGRRRGLWQRALSLSAAGIQTIVYDKVRETPPKRTCRRAALSCLRHVDPSSPSGAGARWTRQRPCRPCLSTTGISSSTIRVETLHAAPPAGHRASHDRRDGGRSDHGGRHRPISRPTERSTS